MVTTTNMEPRKGTVHSDTQVRHKHLLPDTRSPTNCLLSGITIDPGPQDQRPKSSYQRFIFASGTIRDRPWLAGLVGASSQPENLRTNQRLGIFMVPRIKTYQPRRAAHHASYVPLDVSVHETTAGPENVLK